MENIGLTLSSINYLAVLVAVISTFVIGFIWYAPWFLGKIWQKEVGLSDEDIQSANMGKIFGLSFVFTSIAAIALAVMMSHATSAATGMIYALYISIFFIAMQKGVNFQFERRSLRLFAISASHDIVAYVSMGAIIGAWK